MVFMPYTLHINTTRWSIIYSDIFHYNFSHSTQEVTQPIKPLCIGWFFFVVTLSASTAKAPIVQRYEISSYHKSNCCTQSFRAHLNTISVSSISCPSVVATVRACLMNKRLLLTHKTYPCEPTERNIVTISNLLPE